MDTTVFSQGRGVWHVNASPTMRSLGELLMGSNQTVTILPDERSALHGVSPGPYGSVEAAMTAIGLYLAGECRHARRGRPGGNW
jgi:hypothetical protein